VAALMNRILRRTGASITVVSTAGGWLVRTGTGRTTIADNISQIWQSSLTCSVDSAAVQELLLGAATPVSEALWSAYLVLIEPTKASLDDGRRPATVSEGR
jgi:hypothetical protein